jgi:nucleoid DNA-binding protein
MTKADLVDQVAAAVQMPKHQTEEVITRFLEAIIAAVQTEGSSTANRGPRTTAQ